MHCPKNLRRKALSNFLPPLCCDPSPLRAAAHPQWYDLTASSRVRPAECRSALRPESRATSLPDLLKPNTVSLYMSNRFP